MKRQSIETVIFGISEIIIPVLKMLFKVIIYSVYV